MSPLRVGGPAMGLTTPTGGGANLGDVGLGISYSRRTRYTNHADGAVGFSAGLGNPRVIGFDAGIVILDLRPNSQGQGGFGQRGSFAFKLHRRLRSDIAVAAGVDNTLNWGGTDVPASVYVVATKEYMLMNTPGGAFRHVVVSLGAGTGNFRSESRAARGAGGIGGFASVSATLSPALSATLEWTGQDIGAGVSIAPFRAIPVAVAVQLADVAGFAGDGARLGASVTYVIILH